MGITGTRRRILGLWWVTPGLAAFVLLRLPSFLEPHWYTDEAGYVTVAQSLLRGRVLYAQIWNNKPPLHVWTIAVTVWLFGPSEVGLHLLTFLSGALTLAAVGWAGTRLLGPRRAMVAVFIAGVLLGLPILDAELAVPESLLIAPLTWAGAIVLTRLVGSPSSTTDRASQWWPIGVGVLVAVAIAYQQTAVAEAFGFAALIALSPRGGYRALLAYAITVVALTGLWVGLAIAQAGAGIVGYALAGFYLAFTQSVLPSTSAGVAVHVTAAGAALVLLLVGSFMRRRSGGSSWAVLLWAGSALLVPAVAGQPYAHYLLAAVAPVALAIASINLSTRLRALRLRAVGLAAPQAAGVAVAAVMASVAGLDWTTNATGHDLGFYYGGAIEAVFGGQTESAWSDQFDPRVPADAAVAAWLRDEHLEGESAVLWSSDAWVYALAGLPVLMPTPPIYNDEVLLGAHGQVADYVSRLNPMLIIVSDWDQQIFPDVGPLLDGVRYRAVFASGLDTVWERGDAIPAASQVIRPAS